MSRRSLALLLVVVLAIGLMPITAGAAPLYEAGEEFPVSLANEGQVQPDIDFPWMVWKDNRDCGDNEENSDIYAYNFVTGVEVQVSDHPGSESNPSISGDWVVFSSDADDDDYCGVYAHNLATGEEKLLIEVDGVYIGNPAIDGTIVVHNYWDDRGIDGAPYDGDIWAYDLSTDKSWAISPKEGHQYEPEIGDGWVVYRDCDYSWQNDDVSAYNLSTGEEITVAEGYYLDTGSRQLEYGDPSTADGKVVYYSYAYDWGQRNYTIDMYDLSTDSSSTISTVSDNMQRKHPVINDGLVTWHDSRVGVAEVYGYDIAAGEEFLIVPAVEEDTGDGMEWVQYAGRTTTADGIVAWHDHRDEGVNDDSVGDSDDLYAMFMSGSEAGFAGRTRYATAVEVSQANYPDGADTVIIATGENFPDALAGASLAGLYDAPVLLVDDMIPAVVAKEVKRLGATSAIVLGREAAVPMSIDTELKGLGLSVERLGGATRFQTARLIAQKAIKMMGDDWDGTAFLATGYNWPDALSAGPLSAATGWPILLGGPEGDRITDYTGATMDDLGVKDVYVLGGPAVISLGDTGGVHTMALAGEDRYETAVAIAEFGVDEVGLSMGTLAFATGEQFPDALTAGPSQGIAGGSLLITPRASTSSAIMKAVDDNADDIALVKFIGGSAAITQGVRDAIMDALP